jgi:hypothetical protein
MSLTCTARPIELQHTTLANDNRYWPRARPHCCGFAGKEVMLIRQKTVLIQARFA